MKLHPILISLIILTGCLGDKQAEFEDFLDREAQTVTERTVLPFAEPEAVINFTDHEIYSPGSLEQNSTHLFLIDYGTMSIVKVSKDIFSTPEVLQLSEGSGPGELQALQSVAVSDDKIYAGDPRQLRVAVTDTDGNSIRDINTSFSPSRLYFIDDATLLNYNTHQQDHLFALYNIPADSTSGFEEIIFGFDESVKYPGYLSADTEHIFFAGYSEPILRKYSLDGTLLFSMATIDNYNTSDHYMARTMGENRMVGFTEDARYSSMDAAHFNNKLLVIPFHNGEAGFKNIDIYDSSDGSYTETRSVDYYPRKIVLDDDHLYLLARDGEDNFLLKYPNTFIR